MSAATVWTGPQPSVDPEMEARTVEKMAAGPGVFATTALNADAKFWHDLRDPHTKYECQLLTNLNRSKVRLVTESSSATRHRIGDAVVRAGSVNDNRVQVLRPVVAQVEDGRIVRRADSLLKPDADLWPAFSTILTTRGFGLAFSSSRLTVGICDRNDGNDKRKNRDDESCPCHGLIRRPASDNTNRLTADRGGMMRVAGQRQSAATELSHERH